MNDTKNVTILKNISSEVINPKYSSEGCGLVGVFEKFITCRCNHLTDFAAVFPEIPGMEPNFESTYYTSFNPWINYDNSVGFKTLSTMGIIYILLLVICCFLEQKCFDTQLDEKWITLFKRLEKASKKQKKHKSHSRTSSSHKNRKILSEKGEKTKRSSSHSSRHSSKSKNQKNIVLAEKRLELDESRDLSKDDNDSDNDRSR